jgi:hypothetical protein
MASVRSAAERFGVSFEGVFRNHQVVKGRNRDNAWYAITDYDCISRPIWALATRVRSVDRVLRRPREVHAQFTGISFSRARSMKGSSARAPLASTAAAAFSSASCAAAILPGSSEASRASATTR